MLTSLLCLFNTTHLYTWPAVKREEPASQLLPLGLSTVQHHAIPFSELGTSFVVLYTVKKWSAVGTLKPSHIAHFFKF